MRANFKKINDNFFLYILFFRPSPHKLKEDTYERVKYKPGSIDALFDEWKTIQEHYDFGPANPPRSNRAGSDASLCGIARF